jgi:hypothetical protein
MKSVVLSYYHVDHTSKTSLNNTADENHGIKNCEIEFTTNICFKQLKSSKYITRPNEGLFQLKGKMKTIKKFDDNETLHRAQRNVHSSEFNDNLQIKHTEMNTHLVKNRSKIIDHRNTQWNEIHASSFNLVLVVTFKRINKAIGDPATDI